MALHTSDVWCLIIKHHDWNVNIGGLLGSAEIIAFNIAHHDYAHTFIRIFFIRISEAEIWWKVVLKKTRKTLFSEKKKNESIYKRKVLSIYLEVGEGSKIQKFGFRTKNIRDSMLGYIWFTDWLSERLIACFIGWLIGWLNDGMIHWLIVWWLFDWLND